MKREGDYIPALRYRWLTRFYDPIVRATTREGTFKSALVEQAHLLPEHRILDLGCGTGTLAIMIKDSCPGAEVVGIDGDAEVLAIAHSKVALTGGTVQFDPGVATQLPYGLASFDRVLSSLLFHHLHRAEKMTALREAFRVLKPGGELHISDWGRPDGVLMRVAFLPVQILDGFATTSDCVDGILPVLMREAGLADVAITTSYKTVFGTLSLYRGTKS